RIPPSREPNPQGAVAGPTSAAHRRRTTSTGYARRASRTSSAHAGGDDCDARHHSALAPPAHRPQVDVPNASIRPAGCPTGDSRPRSTHVLFAIEFVSSESTARAHAETTASER